MLTLPLFWFMGPVSWFSISWMRLGETGYLYRPVPQQRWRKNEVWAVLMATESTCHTSTGPAAAHEHGSTAST